MFCCDIVKIFKVACKKEDIKKISKYIKSVPQEVLGDELVEASSHNRISTLKYILDSKLPISIDDYQRAFDHSVNQNNIEIVTFLIKSDFSEHFSSNLNRNVVTCCRFGHFEILKMILQHFTWTVNYNVVKELGNCTTPEIVELFLQKNPNNKEYFYDKLCFRAACGSGNLPVAQYLYATREINVQELEDYAFREACRNGHLEVVVWLKSIEPNIEVSSLNYYAFRSAASMGRLEVLKWIHSSSEIPIAILDQSFFEACTNNHLDVANFFTSINPRYTFKIKEGKLVHFIHSHVTKLEECSVCFESSNIITNCGHQFCGVCLSDWLVRDKSCPYCRYEVTDYFTIKKKPTLL